LLAFELYRIALVQCLITILLDRREVYEDVLTSGTLDKSVSFSSIEPLDHAIFLQANSLSDLFHAVASWSEPKQPFQRKSAWVHGVGKQRRNNYINWPSEHFEQ
jgi:hypothetical protein